MRRGTSGNRRARGDDPESVDDPEGVSDCERWREVLSAAIDDEATVAETRAARAHLLACPACRAWQDDAVALTRRVRTRPVQAGPDLVAAALGHLPRRRPWPLRPVTRRVALGVVGVLQMVLGLVALVGVGAHVAGHDHGVEHGASLMGAGLAHIAHETAAWNLAIGAAFVVGAWRPRHLAGLLPGLGVFLVVLAALSVVDLLAGRVDGPRVAAHVVVLVGFVLAVLVVRDGPHRGPAPARGRRERPDDRDEDAVGAGRATPVRRSTPDVA